MLASCTIPKYAGIGGVGGFRNPYDFRLAFYNVDTTGFNLEMQELNQNEELTEEEKIKQIQEKAINHKILCEVIMTEKATREIYNFLGKELEKLDTIKEEKTEIEKD